MMTRRVSIVAGAFLAVSACSDSTTTPPPGTSDVAESTTKVTRPAVDQGDSGPLLNALLAWQQKNLPVEVTDVHDEANGGRTVSAQLRNESDAVTCTGGWGVDDTSPVFSFGLLAHGATGSAVVTFPGGEAGLNAELRLQCVVEWTDVPSMTGLSAQQLEQIAARYPPESAERNNVEFSVRWSPAGTWVGVEVNRRLAMVVPLENAPPPSTPQQ
jgi:hypothetical protein